MNHQHDILPPALTDKELFDSLGINAEQHNDDQPISISGKCHVNTPMLVLFDVDNSSLLLVCPTCSQLVTRVAVKKTEVH